MRIGFIGLGHMGRPMAKRLVASHDVHVFNRSRAPMEDLVGLGATGASSAAEAAADAELVLTVLPGPEEVESVYAELAPSAAAGTIYVDHSTVGLATTYSCAKLIAERGAHFMDAPVSGGPEGAEAGTLTIMIGGSRHAYRRALPIFQLLAKNARLCGGVGAGTAMKLVNQLLVGIHSVAAAEGYALSTKLGVDPSIMLETIGTSFGESRMFSRNVPRFISQDFGGGAAVRLLAKDLRLIRAEASRLKASLPLGSLASARFEGLLELGMGDLDVASVVKLSGVEAT